MSSSTRGVHSNAPMVSGKRKVVVDLPEATRARDRGPPQREHGRPGTVKTLASSINNLFQKSLCAGSSQRWSTL